MHLPQVDVAGALKRLDPEVRYTEAPVALAKAASVGECVMIAEALRPSEELPLPTLDDGRWLLAHTQRELESLRRWFARRIEAPYEGRAPLPRWSALQTRAADHEAFELARPFGSWLASLLNVIRRETQRLRNEAARTLRDLGPEATRLEKVDTALRAATVRAIAERDQRAVRGMRDRFAATLESRGAFPTRQPAWATRLVSEAAQYAELCLEEEAELLVELIQGCIARADQPPTPSLALMLDPEAAPETSMVEDAPKAEQE